jgi:predicted RNase H-like HicB family nuclease
MILEIIVEKDESGYYVGEVPALPGCFYRGY